MVDKARFRVRGRNQAYIIRLFSTAGIGIWDKTLLHGGTASEVFMKPSVLCPSRGPEAPHECIKNTAGLPAREQPSCLSVLYNYFKPLNPISARPLSPL